MICRSEMTNLTDVVERLSVERERSRQFRGGQRVGLNQKNIKFGHWNLPNFRKIDAKGTAKAKPPPRLAKSMDFIEF